MLQVFWVRFWWQYLAKSNSHLVEAIIEVNSITGYINSSLRLWLQNRKILYILVEEDPGLLSISKPRWISFRRNLTAFRSEKLRKAALFCVLAVFFNQTPLWYLPRSNFLFDWSRNLRSSKNRTLVEADPGPLPTPNLELFVTIKHFTAQSCISKHCHKEFHLKC